jgi:hypothetical protein
LVRHWLVVLLVCKDKKAYQLKTTEHHHPLGGLPKTSSHHIPIPQQNTELVRFLQRKGLNQILQTLMT